jgi:hypothetical protein
MKARVPVFPFAPDAASRDSLMPGQDQSRIRPVQETNTSILTEFIFIEVNIGNARYHKVKWMLNGISSHGTQMLCRHYIFLKE